MKVLPLCGSTFTLAHRIKPGEAQRPTLLAVPKSTGENWMGVPEAAQYLGVMPRNVYRGSTSGRSPPSRSGG